MGAASRTPPATAVPWGTQCATEGEGMPHHDISVEDFLLALGQATPIPAETAETTDDVTDEVSAELTTPQAIHWPRVACGSSTSRCQSQAKRLQMGQLPGC